MSTKPGDEPDPRQETEKEPDGSKRPQVPARRAKQNEHRGCHQASPRPDRLWRGSETVPIIPRLRHQHTHMDDRRHQFGH